MSMIHILLHVGTLANRNGHKNALCEDEKVHLGSRTSRYVISRICFRDYFTNDSHVVGHYLFTVQPDVTILIVRNAIIIKLNGKLSRVVRDGRSPFAVVIVVRARVFLHVGDQRQFVILPASKRARHRACRAPIRDPGRKRPGRFKIFVSK